MRSRRQADDDQMTIRRRSDDEQTTIRQQGADEHSLGGMHAPYWLKTSATSTALRGTTEIDHTSAQSSVE